MGLTARAAGRGGLLLVALLAAGLVLWRWAGVDPLGARLEGALLDLRFRLRGPLPPPESTVIVAIDEPALARIGAYAPLRAALAEALGTIAGAGPSMIALDIILADRTAADPALADAIRAAGPVLLAVAATGPGADAGPAHGPAEDAALTRSAIPVVVGQAPETPAPALVLPNGTLLGTGPLAHVNVDPEPDGSVRGIPMAIAAGSGRLLPSMALAAARHGLGVGRGEFVLRGDGSYRIGGRTVHPDRQGRLILDHYGPVGRIPTVNLLAVLDGRTPPGTFARRMVFLGSTAVSLRDAFATPFGATVPGVELQATAAANIVEGRGLRRDGAAFGLTALLALAGALATHAAFRLRRIGASLAAGLGCWGAALAALQAAFAGAGLWLDGVAVIGALAVGTAAGGWARLGREHRGRRNLAHYVAPRLARLLAETAHPAFDGREQEAGLLFVDVAGYSGLVERAPPAETAAFLRALHALFEEAAERHGGVIVDFQGDGALMVFGLPEPSAADAANALACAEALLAGRHDVRAGFLAGPLALRVSVHRGPVACAVLGGRRHAQVSVTGDAVNVTARLQEVAKARGVALVATRAALDAAGATHGLRPLGREWLRGRRGEVVVWGREAGAVPADG